MKDLPNMAQKELGLQKVTAPSMSPASSRDSTTNSPITPQSAGSTASNIPNGSQAGAASGQGAAVPKTKETDASKGRGAFSWGQVMLQKWYWGIFFAVAWAISSRLTDSP